MRHTLPSMRLTLAAQDNAETAATCSLGDFRPAGWTEGYGKDPP